ncbi:MAG: hypothetical protein NTX65_12155 [Ignavibacteriales bacterium]|nr:hypothetical protein [Ignavibacteriales bacterium]
MFGKRKNQNLSLTVLIITSIIIIFNSKKSTGTETIIYREKVNCTLKISNQDQPHEIVKKKSKFTKTVIYNGKTYHTVEIGSQVWLRENLDVGEMIPGNKSAGNNGIIEKYCYDNKQENCDKYGGLYQWDEAMQYGKTPGARGICPESWHIPTFEELQTLLAEVYNRGTALKLEGTNSTGFSALLAGYRRNDNGTFRNLSTIANIWSSTENNSSGAYYLYLFKEESAAIDLIWNSKVNGFSVRCIKD